MLWRLSWWDYHVYLLTGFSATAWAVITEYRRSRSLQDAVSGISVRDPLEQIARGHPEALDTLIGAVEAKDRYTHGHSRRVAELSSKIGITLDLEPEALRGLHQGAFLHDVGKISVPDHILNKPGDLTDEEWEAIKDASRGGLGARATGSDRCGTRSRRSGITTSAGTGPATRNRLEGGDIPLAGRIVGVADVWDALTSDRAYRPAWDPERAIAHIAAGAGSLFDPECVEAFLDVLGESGLADHRLRTWRRCSGSRSSAIGRSATVWPPRAVAGSGARVLPSRRPVPDRALRLRRRRQPRYRRRLDVDELGAGRALEDLVCPGVHLFRRAGRASPPSLR